MCDTFVALGTATSDGSVIFGKNSDREPNEAQAVQIIPAADYLIGSQVSCTYREVPQAPHTYALLLSKPFWMWGAEMGMNEHGVVIGNEAIFTRVAYEKSGLTGMDLLRLALERSKTAFEALHTITQLLETYGQGGNCGFTHGFYYHNSFLIADAQDAWVLETAGRQWVAEQVQGFRSISNAATIGASWDLASKDLVSYAVARGWCKGQADFHFARCYSDLLYTRLSGARGRQVCTMDLLGKPDKLTVLAAMNILRSHHSGSKNDTLDHSLLDQTVCMHAGAGPVRTSQTVGTFIAHLKDGQPAAWVTGTAAPCTGIFKPVWLEAGLPLDEPNLTGTFDARCLWWRHERLHRAVLKDYANRIALYDQERDALEARFVQWVQELPETGAPETDTDHRTLTEMCFHLAEQAEQGWLEKVESVPPVTRPRFYYSAFWKALHQASGL